MNTFQLSKSGPIPQLFFLYSNKVILITRKFHSYSYLIKRENKLLFHRGNDRLDEVLKVRNNNQCPWRQLLPMIFQIVVLKVKDQQYWEWNPHRGGFLRFAKMVPLPPYFLVAVVILFFMQVLWLILMVFWMIRLQIVLNYYFCESGCLDSRHFLLLAWKKIWSGNDTTWSMGHNFQFIYFQHRNLPYYYCRISLYSVKVNKMLRFTILWWFSTFWCCIQ